MPYQNRVTPWGDIISVTDRGLYMGNRGCLHDAQGRLGTKAWVRKAWVICQIEFKGRQRTVMSPGQYTELFFLDEVAALAAGHRPCATCRRDAYNQFKLLWLAENTNKLPPGKTGVAGIDEALHRERLTSDGEKRTWFSHLGSLPDGTFVQLDGAEDAWLVQGDALLHWTTAGYDRRIVKSPEQQVKVLTPESIVRVLSEGYQPVVHPTGQR